MSEENTVGTPPKVPKAVTVVQRTPQVKQEEVLFATNPGLPNWDSATPADKQFIHEARKKASVVSAGYIDFFVSYAKSMNKTVSAPGETLRSMKAGLFRNMVAMFDRPGPDFQDCTTAILKIISIEKTQTGGGAFSEPHCFVGIDMSITSATDRQDFKYMLSALIGLSSPETRATDLKMVNLDKAFQCLTPAGLKNISAYFRG